MAGVPRGRKSFLVSGVSEKNYLNCLLPVSILLIFFLIKWTKGREWEGAGAVRDVIVHCFENSASVI
jgi:hypothetical protein